MKFSYMITVMLCGFCLQACAQPIPNKDNQIAAAVLAAPEEERDHAAVYGYDANGKMRVLREGSNNMVCLADNPTTEGFSVACYHKDLDPFMARGRALRAEGKNRQEVFDIRFQEAKDGTLQMPENPSTLHILAGQNGYYDAASGEAREARYRWVVYIPWATAASTGLPTKPVIPGAPWIMDPGTHKAHIMVTPPTANDFVEN